MTKIDLRPALAKMLPYAPGEQPPPGKFIKLNTNENPYPPAPAVVSALQEAATGPLNRYPDPMANAFRRAAADALGLPGPEWVLAGNGSDDILTILVRGFVGEQEKLRLPYPSYILYRTLADIQAANWEQIHFLDGWHLPTHFTNADDDLRLVFLPNPNSPSGTVVAPEQISEIASALPCPLVVDEAYADFADSNCLDLVQKHDNLLVTRTFSKAYGLAGIRFGFLVAQPALINRLASIKDSYNCDYLSIVAATAAISQQDWLTEVVAKLKQTRQRMEQRLTEMDFHVTPSQANFVWAQHPQGQHQELYDFLKKNQILVRYMDFPDWGDGIRISVGTDQQIDACMMMIERFFQ
ncbi:Histidinol-phosphate aminotransferase [Stieleria bergensis]|uniref:Histidinol-phosphate aminotransferase n=1 Tax=Stieleria bergensis TaxID=2528025 RepID=A0A517SQI6_9BACT|nr:Histidinol-phosphate aminotransferase [Planctomycetes bacterium SV_7m_r]